MMRGLLIVAAITAACWESWRWYLQRVWSTPEEAVALAAAGALVVMVRPTTPEGAAVYADPAGRGLGQGLPVLALLLVLYAVSAGFAPPIMRAALAVLALLAALHGVLHRASPPPALWLMGLLATPLVPTLQFYLGYPMRLASAAVAVVLLRGNGLAVDRQGTYLVWRGDLVQFDAPCSGVSMLWAGLLLASLLGYVHRLGWLSLSVQLGLCTVLLVVANILRATSLFYLETGQVAWAATWMHEASGLAAFAVAAVGVVRVSGWLASDTRAPHPRTVHARGRGEGASAGKRAGVLAASVLTAALSPLMTRSVSPAGGATMPFPGWPSHYDGRIVSALPMSDREIAFASGFPGRIGRFSDGEREIIVRFVTTATRKLHPASDCFRGLGYTITPVAMRRNGMGKAMSCFVAKGKDGSFRVCEHLDEAAGGDGSWPDIGAWYWHAALAQARGGWWSYTVAERI